MDERTERSGWVSKGWSEGVDAGTVRSWMGWRGSWSEEWIRVDERGGFWQKEKEIPKFQNLRNYYLARFSCHSCSESTNHPDRRSEFF